MRPVVERILVGAACAVLFAATSSGTMADDSAAISTGRPGSAPNYPSALAPKAGATTAPTAMNKRAQSTVYTRFGATSSTVIRPALEVPVTTQTTQALNFYGGNSARATLSQMPRRAPLQSVPPLPSRPVSKPFQTVYRDPTISPYLNLYRQDEATGSAPNYFAFVRPQMDQIEANRAQQRELQQLRGQLNGVSSTIVGANYQNNQLPGTGTPSRYMDTAQFYSGRRR